ncbi:putative mitochondrial protein, partial [Mucuna pruriens]
MLQAVQKKICNYCKNDGHIIKECPTRLPRRIATTFIALVDSSIPSSFPNPTPIQQNAPWYINYRVSNHMTSNAQLLTNIKKYSRNLKIHIVDGNQLSITIIGDISSSLTNIFVSPGLMINLIFVGQLVDNGCRVQFSQFGCLVQDQHSGKIIVKGPKRLGYPNSNVLHDMLKSIFLGNKYISSLNVVHFDCISCKLGKSKILSFPTHHPNVTQPFEIIHIVSLGFIFCTQKMKYFPFSNSFMLMFKLNSLPKSKFFALIMEGNIHHTHFMNSCNPMTLYLKGHAHHTRPPQDNSLVIASIQEPKSTTLSHSSCIRKPLERYISSLTTTLSSIAISSSYKQAMENKCRQKAIETELLTLDENQTWDIVSCPPSLKSLGNKFVFFIKLHSDGSIDRYKAQMVVLGNKQEYALDYDETFALVAKMTTVHTILALATSQS